MGNPHTNTPLGERAREKREVSVYGESHVRDGLYGKPPYKYTVGREGERKRAQFGSHMTAVKIV